MAATITEISELNMILVSEWNGGMNTAEICKRYNVPRWRLKNAIEEYYNVRKSLIEKIKSQSENPQTEPKLLEIGNVICASFANLTVGDILINNGKIQGIRTNN